MQSIWLKILPVMHNVKDFALEDTQDTTDMAKTLYTGIIFVHTDRYDRHLSNLGKTHDNISTFLFPCICMSFLSHSIPTPTPVWKDTIWIA